MSATSRSGSGDRPLAAAAVAMNATTAMSPLQASRRTGFIARAVLLVLLSAETMPLLYLRATGLCSAAAARQRWFHGLDNARPMTLLRILVLSLTGAVGAFAAATLAGSQPEAAGASATSNGSTVIVTITDTKLTLRPAAVPAGVVVFKVVDAGLHAHAFAIRGKTTPQLRHARSAVLKVAFGNEGSYKAIARTASGSTLRAT